MNNAANTKDRGTQREILTKRPKTNNNMNKASEAILSILGDCWEKCIRSSLPARLMEEFPGSRVQPTLCSNITGQFRCGLKVGGGGGGRGFWHITHSSYSWHQIPSDTLNYLFPSNTFLRRTYYFFYISQPAKICLKNRHFEEQIHWIFPWKEGTDGQTWRRLKRIAIVLLKTLF